MLTDWRMAVPKRQTKGWKDRLAESPGEKAEHRRRPRVLWKSHKGSDRAYTSSQLPINSSARAPLPGLRVHTPGHGRDKPVPVQGKFPTPAARSPNQNPANLLTALAERYLIPLAGDFHGGSFADHAPQNELRKRVFHQALDGAPQRPCAERRVEALLYEKI